MPLDDLVLADQQPALAAGLTKLADLDPVGVDVERADWNRYWRAAALIQVGGAGRVVIVDPLALEDLTLLQEFLVDRTVVLHAMENDLAPLRAAGVEPDVVEDTAIAAALLGLPTGLENLLAELLGVRLEGDKNAMQRADWERRPLREEMLVYAAGDVADLPGLWAALARRLDAAGRRDWYLEEREALLALPPAEQRRHWTRTKGIGRLDPDVRGRVRALWETRERLARDHDTAPGRIIGDRALIELAAAPVTSTSTLPRRGMRRQAVRDFGDALLAALAGAEGLPAPGLYEARPPTDADRVTADRLRAIRAARAHALGIDAGVLCPSRTLLTALLTDPATPQDLHRALGLRPWQWAQLGNAFCEALGLQGPGKPDPVDDPV